MSVMEASAAIQRGIVPRGFSAPGRQMIQAVQERPRTLGAAIGQWEMLIVYFKHALEIPLCIEQDNESLKDDHRVTLTAALSMGEILLASAKEQSDDELERSGYSRKFIEANLRYLRMTYEQWYVERDNEAIEATYQFLCNGCAITAPRNS